MSVKDNLLTIEEVANLLDCTQSTVEGKVRKGILPGVKFGRSWIFVASTLIKAIEDLSLQELEKRKQPIPIEAVKDLSKGKRKTPPALN